VVGDFLAGERAGEALGDFRQHRRVPRLPLGDDSVIDVLVALLKITALERILDHVEQKGAVEDFEELVVADACGALLVAPEQLSIDRCDVDRERGQPCTGYLPSTIAGSPRIMCTGGA
jgi:hypothetical protein